MLKKDLFSINTMQPYVFKEKTEREKEQVVVERQESGTVIQASEAPAPSVLDVAQLNKMTKKELEEFAAEEFDIELDRRKTKEEMIEQLLNDPNTSEE